MKEENEIDWRQRVSPEGKYENEFNWRQRVSPDENMTMRLTGDRE